MSTLPLSLSELDTAESFFEFFGIDYSRGVIDVNRLLILRRFHDSLAEQDLDGIEEKETFALVRALPERAYAAYAAPRPASGVVAPPPPTAAGPCGPRQSPKRTFVPISAILGSTPNRRR